MDALMNAQTQPINIPEHHDEIIRHSERLNVVETEVRSLREAVKDIASMKSELRIVMWLVGVVAVATTTGLISFLFSKL